MILCLKLLMFVADFSSEGRLFHILGPKHERPFCPVLLFRKGRISLFLDLRVTRLWPTGKNISNKGCIIKKIENLCSSALL